MFGTIRENSLLLIVRILAARLRCCQRRQLAIVEPAALLVQVMEPIGLPPVPVILRASLFGVHIASLAVDECFVRFNMPRHLVGSAQRHADF